MKHRKETLATLHGVCTKLTIMSNDSVTANLKIGTRVRACGLRQTRQEHSTIHLLNRYNCYALIQPGVQMCSKIQKAERNFQKLNSVHDTTYLAGASLSEKEKSKGLKLRAISCSSN